MAKDAYYARIGKRGGRKSAAVRQQRAAADPLVALTIHLRESDLRLLETARSIAGRSRSHWLRVAVRAWWKELGSPAAHHPADTESE